MHIIIKAEFYTAQIGLKQCYNWQNFGHVWGNCKQSPRCLWSGVGHLHRECPGKTNTEFRQSCCSCTLVEGEKRYSASYRGCSHAKGEEYNELPRDPLGGRSSLSSSHQSNPTQLPCVVLSFSIGRRRRGLPLLCGLPETERHHKERLSPIALD
jgi:hypothetical protein